MPTLTRTDVEVRSSHLRAFRLDGTQVALVPEQAVLLADDRVEVQVRVGAGRVLEIIEPGGTVAYAMRGSSARWDVSVEVEEGGSLVWHGEPFVVSQGADVRRHLTLELGAASRVVLRETLVLGRSGEAPGRLVSRTDVRGDGVPVLVEELDAAVGMGSHRVLDQVLCLGTGCASDGLVLESGDRLHRWLGAETHASPISASTVAACQSSPSEE
jgi:urease accessory protein